MLSLGAVLHNTAQRTPNKTALFCGEAQVSYEALDRSTTALANWFLDQGLEAGDHVAVHWTNSIHTVQLLYGLFKAGLIAVTINTRLKPAEIGFILNHAGVKMCFSEPALSSLAQQAAEQVDARCPIFSDLPAIEAAEARQSALTPVETDRPAALLYTSGTTARPKGVLHTHRSLYHTGVLGAILLALPQDDINLCVLPLMHIAALSGILTSIYEGRTVALLSRFDSGAALDAIARFACTSLVCMPALWHFILDEQARQPRCVASLKTAYAAGDAVPIALQNRFETAFGVPLQEAYGMTESAALAVNPRKAIRSGSLGLAAEGVELRIVDLAGQEVAEGETGEVLVRSPASCIGYWNDAEATQAAIQDGWLHTGDLASRDSDGYYWFRGRRKEIIIRAGSNISPQEVEDALYRHPAILQAGVTGQPDPVYGEIVVAFVVLRDGFEADPIELRQFARKYLADYKVPEKFIFLADLPRSPTGKVHRGALRSSLLSASAAAT